MRTRLSITKRPGTWSRLAPRTAAMLLPQCEMAIYLLLSVGFHLYSFYQVYLVSNEQVEEFDDEFVQEGNPLFWGMKRDASDFEWSFWIGWARKPLLVLFLGHVALSQMARLLLGGLWSWCLMIYGMVACLLLLGFQGFGLLLFHISVAFAVAQLRIPSLSWVCSLLLLSTLHIEALEKETRGWYRTENEYYLLQFTLTVRCLYYTSFCLEYCWHGPGEERGCSLPWLLLYMFYYPMFLNGPILNFCDFHREMQKQDSSVPRIDLVSCILGLGRLLSWWWLAELMIHLMHMHTMCSSEALLESASHWTMGGLALAQVLFFYVKYLVLYGIPALIMRMDGLEPLPLPRCVSTMYSFTGMWRSFDIGLHRFLIRYIYIPMGGSKSGLCGMLFSTGLTFAFVSYWHGAHPNLWYWAALNWIGIIIEYIVKILLSTSVAQNIIWQTLSQQTQRRLHAALAAISTSMLILTNLVFLGGEFVGQIYWDRFFVKGWPWISLTVWGFLYGYAQIGIEWDSIFHQQ